MTQYSHMVLELPTSFNYCIFRGPAGDWYEAITGLLRQSKIVRLWFAQNVLFTHSERISEYLLESPSPEVKLKLLHSKESIDINLKIIYHLGHGTFSWYFKGCLVLFYDLKFISIWCVRKILNMIIAYSFFFSLSGLVIEGHVYMNVSLMKCWGFIFYK